MSASPLEVGWPGSLVREDHGEVSPLAREGISSVGDSPSIRPVTGRPSLAPRSRPCCLVGPSCERLSLSPLVCEAGKTAGLPRSADVPVWVRSCLYAGGSPSAPQEFAACGPGHIPFWSKRFSSLRLFSCDGACDTSPGLTLPTPSWFPTASLLAVAVTARAWAALPREEATLSRGLLSR